MRSRSIHYNLEHGFVHNWLAAGPQAIPVELEQFQGDNIRQLIAQRYYESTSRNRSSVEITKTPVERGPLTEGLFQVGDYSGSWNYYPCREDHLVDHSGTYPGPHFLRSWAYTQLANKKAQEVLFVLTTHGPVDLWLNGKHVQRQEYVFEQHLAVASPARSLPFKVLLKKGVNKILIRFEAVAIQECPHAMALQVCKLRDGQPAQLAEQEVPMEPYPANEGIHVSIPTLIDRVSRRNQFERVAAVTYIDRDVFEPNDQIRLRWPEDLEEPSPANIRLMTNAGQIYAEATVDGTAGDQLFLSFPLQIPEGPYRIFIMPLTWEYYNFNLRITREINLWSLGRHEYSTIPYGTLAERRQEALVSAIERKGLFAEIAKMALNRWTELDTSLILQTAQRAKPEEVLGMLGVLYRFGKNAQFPKKLLQPLDDCILGYPYGPVGDTGSSIPQGAEQEVPGVGESDSILFHASEILAGQRYPDRTFLRTGKTGQWHRENGERLALEWLHQRGAGGFSDWDSNISFAEDLLALSHLVDLAESESVWEMAAVILDKLFFTIAINSFQGVFGSTHGRTYAPFVKGGFLEPTSSITRLMWGTGIFNHHIAGTVSLACMEKYELPSIISDIAISKPEEMWSRERHAVAAPRAEQEVPIPGVGPEAKEVNLVTYKTPDVMLSSAQDYCPGEKGRLEHIWQATLGKAATVFVTHPACTSEEAARQPNFWAGNAILPRVAQWKDALIALYNLPAEDWMGFTHAYFPALTFDEYVLREGWAFGRKEDGYVAVTNSQGFDFIQQGLYAYRELRSFGQHQVWVCQMGRAKQDGDFIGFQEKVLALPIVYDGLAVRFTTLRGDTLAFDWEKPLQLNGVDQTLSGFKHFDNIYTHTELPCREMVIQYGEDGLHLDFQVGQTGKDVS